VYHSAANSLQGVIIVGCGAHTSIPRIFWQNLCNFDECIPIGDFSFDPHKLVCCSLESGNILSHGSGGKGYGLATTAITSGCFIWKVQVFALQTETNRKQAKSLS